MLPDSLCLLIAALIVTLTSASEFDFTVEVPPGRMSCFFQTVTDPKYAHMEIDYQVIDGGDLNINVMVLFGGNVVIQDRMKNDGSHRINVQNQKGDYQICFDNSFSYQERKVVFFEIFLYDINNQLDELDYEKMAFGDKIKDIEELGIEVDKVKSIASRLKVNLNKAEHYQALLRAWEARDMAIMNANLSRVSFWSVLNGVVLILVGTLQVYMIRSLFEDNSRVGKLLRAGGKAS